MKKFKLFSIVLAIAILAIVTLFGTNTFATKVDETSDEIILTTGAEGNELTTELSEGENVDDVTTEQPDIYEGDLYVFFGEEEKTATTYTMDKLVDGNVFIFGNDVTVTGQIKGSLFVFATKLTIDENAYIGMDLFACAQDITMSGYAFDIYAACTNFDLTNTGIAYRDLKLFTNNAHLIGSVGRDIDLGATNITVYDDEENALFVGRNLKYSSGNEIEHIDDITVYGEVKYEEAVEEEEDTNPVLDFIIDAITSIIFTLAIYAALIFLVPKFVEKSKEYVSTRGLLAAAVGLAFTILVPILAFILLFTVVGVSLAIAIALVYAIVLVFNSAIVVTAINEFVCGKVEKLKATWKKILMVIPVSLILFLIEQIPFVGGVVSLVVFLVGVGIVTLYQFDKRRKEKVTE